MIEPVKTEPAGSVTSLLLVSKHFANRVVFVPICTGVAGEIWVMFVAVALVEHEIPVTFIGDCVDWAKFIVRRPVVERP